MFLLGYPDSNQERQDQNLQCYHYTIPQYSNNFLTHAKNRKDSFFLSYTLLSQCVFSKCAAKVQLFL